MAYPTTSPFVTQSTSPNPTFSTRYFLSLSTRAITTLRVRVVGWSSTPPPSTDPDQTVLVAAAAGTVVVVLVLLVIVVALGALYRARRILQGSSTATTSTGTTVSHVSKQPQLLELAEAGEVYANVKPTPGHSTLPSTGVHAPPVPSRMGRSVSVSEEQRPRQESGPVYATVTRDSRLMRYNSR